MKDKRILIVEDDEDLRDFMAAHLESHYGDVRVAGDGQEALELIDNEGLFDLILLDLMMPVMNGLQFLQNLRHLTLDNVPLQPIEVTGQNDSFVRSYFRKQLESTNEMIHSIPVIIITAKDHKEDVISAKRLGITAYLRKPIDQEKLLKRVKEVIQETLA